MTTDKTFIDVLRRHQRTLTPEPTSVAASLIPLAGIRSVLFDIYGTLLISGSGDIGTVATTQLDQVLTAALEAAGIDQRESGSELMARFRATIGTHHQRARNAGIAYPEVDIVDVWRDVLGDPAEELDASTRSRYQRLAVEYEARANPVAPMPFAKHCLTTLRDAEMRLGIISNAQFFTPFAWQACLDEAPTDLGIDQAMQYYSYEFGQAKPGTFLFERAAESLKEGGIDVSETLYVGNDMKNDMLPASQIGFRTALFAGEQRSLRLRSDDPQVENVRPDVVVTDLRQLIAVVCE